MTKTLQNIIHDCDLSSEDKNILLKKFINKNIEDRVLLEIDVLSNGFLCVNENGEAKRLSYRLFSALDRFVIFSDYDIEQLHTFVVDQISIDNQQIFSERELVDLKEEGLVDNNYNFTLIGRNAIRLVALKRRY